MMHQDSARRRIREALAYQFAKITEADGYPITVFPDSIFFTMPVRSAILKWPAVVILSGREQVRNTNISDQLLHKAITYTVLVYAAPETVPAEEAERFCEDALACVEELIGNNDTLPDAAGAATAMTSLVGSNEAFRKLVGVDGKSTPYHGIAVEVRVWYRQEIKDPSIMA